MSGRVYGYARVSSKDQNLERQREALAGVDVLVEEQVSGKNVADREKLRTLMAFAQAGDTIRVKSIDRLARDTRDLLRALPVKSPWAPCSTGLLVLSCALCTTEGYLGAAPTSTTS